MDLVISSGHCAPPYPNFCIPACGWLLVYDRRISVLDAIEEQMRVNDGNKPPENKFFQTVRSIGDWLIDKTENSDGEFTAARTCCVWTSAHNYFVMHVGVAIED